MAPRDHVELARLVRDDYAGRVSPIRAMHLDGMDASLYLCRSVLRPGSRSPALVLVCRGSTDARDWRRNLRCMPAPFRRRLWHRGFLAEARVVLGFLFGLPSAPWPDWITGHSRGAAVAAIVGTAIRRPTVVFSQPRCLWLGPQPDAAHLVTAYALEADPVPYLGRLLGYRHVGRVRWLDGYGHGISTYLQAMGGDHEREADGAPV